MQETEIARMYGGQRSPSSGAASTDRGDVRTDSQLIECKSIGSETKPTKSFSIKLEDWFKIRDEAWQENRDPVMAFRVYCDDPNGHRHIDLVLRGVIDDVRRANYSDLYDMETHYGADYRNLRREAEEDFH